MRAPSEVLEAFRNAWSSHDIRSLGALFAGKFQYNIDGKTVYQSKSEIKGFWYKNALDQQELSVKFFNPSYGRGRARAYFSALFYTPRRCRIVSVSGYIEIWIDSAGKISRLDQYSGTIERPSFIYSFAYLKRRIIDPVSNAFVRALRPFWRSFGTVTQVALYVVMAVGVLLVLYAEILHGSLRWASEETFSDIKKYTPFWFALAYIVQQTIALVKWKVLHDVHFLPIEGEGDLKIMQRFIDKANNVEIVSGDFSFLDTDSDLQNRLKELAFSKKLKLVSYKPEQKVKDELKVKSTGREILAKLKEDNSIVYDFPVEAKVTIVTHGRNRRMLFRYWRDVDGEQRRYMGVVRDTSNTGALLDVIVKLIDKVKS